MTPKEFLNLLMTNFRVKRFEDDDAKLRWASLLVREMSCYDPKVLKRAAEDMMRRRKNEYFPQLAELHEWCRDSKRVIDAQTLPLDREAAPSPMWSGERQRLADELVMGNMGKAAAQQGWVYGLHMFVVDQGRMPEPLEIGRLRAASQEFDRNYDRLLNGEMSIAPEIRASLVHLASEMTKRRENLSRRVLGD